jgi:glycosyltransferase involved in cell wall biosynthesis
MKIAMFTNLYRPMVGGVTVSIDRFSRAYRQRGHHVLIAAPTYPGQPDREQDVVRVPAIQNFNGTDFSVALPPGPELSRRLDDFGPDLIHAHHPFLMGDAAARAASHRRLPLVYTHHTMYEHYTHYVPLDCKALRNYVVQLAARYAEFCDLVFAPSESIAALLRRRGVTTRIEAIPTGVVVEDFAGADGSRGRRLAGLNQRDVVVGHVGRIAEEKNLRFLTRAVLRAMRRIEGSRFLLVGSGDLERTLRAMIAAEGLGGRAVFGGSHTGRDLADLYAAMDVFAFASKSETQGMVLAEALAAGTPVVALDAPGAREIVRDGQNGRLVGAEDEAAFADALAWVAARRGRQMQALRDRARADAGAFALDHCAEEALRAYRRVLKPRAADKTIESVGWSVLLESIRREWAIWTNRAASLTDALTEGQDPRDEAS